MLTIVFLNLLPIILTEVERLRRLDRERLRLSRSRDLGRLELNEGNEVR